jgi:uncharacterized membrane protein YtjA (UPF0391 family)
VPGGPLESAEFVTAYLRHKLIYSVCGLVLGCVCILAGAILFLNGIVGTSNWTAKVLDFQTQLNDAAPGSILFVVGVAIVFITRHKVDVHVTPTRLDM